jgi:hypothetical protein
MPFLSSSLAKRSEMNTTLPAPTIDEVDLAGNLRVLSLEALVRMRRTSFRDKDCVHVRDLLDIGLIDASWCSRYPPELGARLQELIDDPDG